MTPRQQIGSVGFANQTEKATDSEKLGGLSNTAWQRTLSGSCPDGEFLSGFNQSGTPACATPAGTTYTNGPGLSLSANAFSVIYGTTAGTAVEGNDARLSGNIGGVGAANYIPKFSTGTTLSNSALFENGGNIGIGTSSPAVKLDVNGSARITSDIGASTLTLNSPSLPTCSATLRGQFNYTAAGGGQTDVVRVCAKDSSNNYSWRSVWPPTFVQVLRTGNGTISSNPAGINCGDNCFAPFDFGVNISLTATPTAYWAFSGWSGACTGTGTCSVSANGISNVSATFTQTLYSLTVTRIGAGTVVSDSVGLYCGAACSATYAGGSVVTLTATADAGKTFQGWSGGLCTGTSVCVVTMTGAKSVVATFN